MTVNFTKGQFNLREKLKELERPSVDKLVTKDNNGSAYIDTISGSTKLESIDSVISDTAVDVFVYDTRKDSDGGAWRKRTQHTSWYNETLNTTTRGSRREFPAVAVIVATADDVIIYDGDDPDLPMWMVFESDEGATAYDTHFLGRSSSHSFSAPITSISMLNGLLSVGKTGSSNFLESFNTIDFIKEDVLHRAQSSFARHSPSSISNRNNAVGFISLSSTGGTVNAAVNDVAMTVLPNAPIDSATGLQVPTIAVATNGGVSVIKDDGTVVDLTYSSTNAISRFIDITSDGKIRYGGRSYSSSYNFYLYTYKNIPSSDTSAAPDTLYTYTGSGSGSSGGGNGYYFLTTQRNGQTSPLADSVDIGDGEFVVSTGSFSNGGQYGIHKIVEYDSFNSSSVPEPLVAIATTSFNTGWLHGNCKGAFLSDTDATNVTGSELITNGDFASNSDWTTIGDTGLSISGGQATITLTTTNGEIYQNLPTLSAGTYVFSVEKVGGTETNLYATLQDATSGATRYNLILESNISNGTYSATVTIPSTESNLRVAIYGYFWGGTHNGFTLILDNVSLRIAELDRSVNNNGLQVFGTITKSAVAGSGATAAELVAYSGWSSSNYLLQPHNSDLNFGTGDFSIMLWMKNSVAGHDYAMSMGIEDSGANPRLGIRGSTDYTIALNQSGSILNGIDSGEYTTGEWQQVIVTRSGGLTSLYVDSILKGTTSYVEDYSFSGNPDILLGHWPTNKTYAFGGSLALLRISKSAPSAEQIKKIYEDEKVLFQENVDCTLYGSSDAVTALAYDDSTNLLYAGTSSGRSDFQGLRRINNTTTAVTTAMSASNGLVAEQ